MSETNERNIKNMQKQRSRAFLWFAIWILIFTRSYDGYARNELRRLDSEVRSLRQQVEELRAPTHNQELSGAAIAASKEERSDD